MKKYNLLNWMSMISDDTSICDLLIPGTHDTMTATCDQRYYKTQNLSLDEQLQCGVRFFDMRIRREMIAAHREWHSNITMNEIMSTLKDFLEKYPSEVIIMRVQNANELKDDYPEYGIALKNELVKFMPLFYKWDSRATIFPNLGLVRGKIIALECSPIEYKFYEFDNKIWAQTWHDNKFIDLQDLWDGPSIEDKKQAIKNNFTAKISNILFLNHISATNGDLGYPDSYANILNSYFLSLCNETEYKNGVQIMDFIDEKLSKQCVDSNFQL